MNIQKAVKKAIKIDGYITGDFGGIKSFDGRVFIKPTNKSDGCIICLTPDEQCRRWQPRAADLMSDTWRVVTKEEFLSPSINYNLS